ncbi:MAG: YceI family protein [Polyangiaceae bacterium]
MNRTWSLAALTGISLAFSAGCNNNPVENKSIAKVEQAAQVPNAPSEAGVPYEFSEAGSELAWVGAKVTGKHDGKFSKFSGQIQLVGNDPTKSAVKVEVVAASLSADNEKLTGHLKSPDFFDVEKYPTIRFQSSKIETGGERGATHTVTGNLELHGVTKFDPFPGDHWRCGGQRNHQERVRHQPKGFRHRLSGQTRRSHQGRGIGPTERRGKETLTRLPGRRAPKKESSDRG